MALPSVPVAAEGLIRTAGLFPVDRIHRGHQLTPDREVEHIVASLEPDRPEHAGKPREQALHHVGACRIRGIARGWRGGRTHTPGRGPSVPLMLRAARTIS